jgi:1-acyl-sn-glycerol-3-phosphate acyltransferase
MYAPSLTDRVAGSAMLARRQKLGRGIGHALGRLDVVGLENVPRTGPLVVAGNHLSFWDGPLIFAYFPRPVTFLVKHEMFVGPVTPVLRSAGQVPIVRGRVDASPASGTWRCARGPASSRWPATAPTRWSVAARSAARRRR